MRIRALIENTTRIEDARPASPILLPGPMFPILFAATLPAAINALASGGRAQQVSSLIAIGWASLVPLSLYERWAARVLPLAAALFLVVALVALPFASTAMTVDAWTAAAMCVLSLPRAPSRVARRDSAPLTFARTADANRRRPPQEGAEHLTASSTTRC